MRSLPFFFNVDVENSLNRCIGIFSFLLLLLCEIPKQKEWRGKIQKTTTKAKCKSTYILIRKFYPLEQGVEVLRDHVIICIRIAIPNYSVSILQCAVSYTHLTLPTIYSV